MQPHIPICTDNHDKNQKFCLQKQLEFNNEFFFFCDLHRVQIHHSTELSWTIVILAGKAVL